MTSPCGKLIKKAFFADNTTLKTSNMYAYDSINTLENDMEVQYQWFEKNRFKIDLQKNTYLVSQHVSSINQNAHKTHLISLLCYTSLKREPKHSTNL